MTHRTPFRLIMADFAPLPPPGPLFSRPLRWLLGVVVVALAIGVYLWM